MIRRIIVVALAMTAAVWACRASDTSADSTGTYATRTSRGNISYDLTPRLLDGGQLVVEVRATTHSGDLAELDLGALMSLEAGGKTYRPVAATALRGHHALGKVTFRVDAKPERFVITIGPARGMGEQRFEWP